eukprot:GEMP01015709.1.p1 GENE.GEMP01015709.1~~GEMP01015709.1.p1  ORF type:complete len:300 (+),score=60.38 GEMP01015709.1:392-1291(+)
MEPSSSSSSSLECRPLSEEEKDEKEEKSGEKSEPNSERRDKSERQKKKSKKSGGNEIDGCAHYRRRCRIVAPCCGEVCWCRHCHTEKTQHELDRKAIKEVICSKCHKRQPRGRHCTSCDVLFGEYYCGICNFWDDEGNTKKVFHCDDCGICRIGGRENYFHCQKCGCCYPMEIRDNHKCVANAMQQDCPICLHDLFQSTTQVTILQCGHTIHQSCLAEMRKSFSGLQNLRCPICSLSLDDFGEIWKELDLQVSNTPMPEEYSKIMVKIICCDCQKFSEVAFHVIGHKCTECSSYNTRRA